MKDRVMICFPDGRKKELELPKYGVIQLTIRNEKVTDIETNKKEKIC